ncbi:MAG: sel1 repeat family protein [Lachnospiraceae bacterium]|nr:sel1 repeat family protein [Lachnospiraceae bacterium]
MKIENIEELEKRVDLAIKAVAADVHYAESLGVLTDIREEMELYDFDENKDHLSMGLHEADGAYPMHPEVAKLLIDIYEDGIENESADAMCDLGSLYYTGRAGEQNYEKAAYYYDMADKAGNRQATENMGYIYYYGRIGQRDYEKAFKYFVKGALDGHLRSLYKVGDFYKNGYYVEKDPKEAFRIYEHCTNTMTDEAAPLVGADVYMRMGDCFYEGFGVEKDLMIAQRFMSSAENMFYTRLAEGDFYQKRNLEHVLDVLAKIRKEIHEELLPDLSWAGYND